MPTVEVEGQQFEFPEGTDDQTMGVAIRNHFAQQDQQAGSAEAGFAAGAGAVESELERIQRLQRGEVLPGAEAIPPAVETLQAGLEAPRTLLTGMVAEPFAGLAGIATGLSPFAEEGAAEEAVAGVREAITTLPETQLGQERLARVGETLTPVAEAFQTVEGTLGDAVLEATGSPELAAVAHTLPTAALEALGVGLGRRAVSTSKAATTKAQKAVDAITDAKAGKVTDEGLADVADVIKRGSPEEVAQVIDADPNFYRAADELGINTEPLAGFASRNPQFRDVEAALRKVPGSVLEPQAMRFIEDTSRAADDLIQRYGGTLDKAQLGLDFKRDALKSIDDLATQADDVYGTLRDLIPEGNRFEAPSTVDFLTDLKVKEKIPPRLNKILRELQPKDVKTKGRVTVDPAIGARTDTGRTRSVPPTLGKIDQVRREVGQAINKGSGPFKDVEAGLNKAVYARLTADQDAIAASSGASDVSDAAKGLIRQRKQLEDNLQFLLGRDLNKALNVNVAGAIKNLSKGQVDQFNEVMRAIPKAKRGEAALSAMNDVFKGTGVNQQGLSPTQFTKWYQTINRSPAAKKALFDALPLGSQKAIDNLFEVSRGISRSLGQTTPTGRINALFNPETGIIRKMAGRAAASGVAFATGSPVASAATSATMDFLRQATDGAKAASDLMGTPQFQNIVRQSVKEGVVDGAAASKKLLAAEAKLARSKQFESWANALGKADRAALQGGLVSYLFREENQENK